MVFAMYVIFAVGATINTWLCGRGAAHRHFVWRFLSSSFDEVAGIFGGSGEAVVTPVEAIVISDEDAVVAGEDAVISDAFSVIFSEVTIMSREFAVLSIEVGVTLDQDVVTFGQVVVTFGQVVFQNRSFGAREIVELMPVQGVYTAGSSR
ncbi:MAG: hypothetical protein AAGF11_25865 [Myxococcota bacterium]